MLSAASVFEMTRGMTRASNRTCVKTILGYTS
jgi:hypothetical protein